MGDVGRLQAHRVDAFGDLQQLRAGARAAEAAQLDDRVALAGDAVVELDHRLPDPRPDGAQARDRGDHVGAAADVLDPERVRDAGAREQLPPAALGPEVGERGVGAHDRDAELLAERELELGRDVRDEVGGLVVGDLPADAGEQRRALQQLRGERAQGGVLRAEHRQPVAGVVADVGGEQTEVVLDDLLGHGHGRHVDHADAAFSELQQQTQQAFFVRLRLGWGLVELLDRPGRDDHDRRGSPHGGRKYDDSRARCYPTKG